MSSLIQNYTYPILEWTFCSAAIVATLGRFYIRWRYHKTIKWDDVFNGLALASLIAFIAITEIADYGNNLLRFYKLTLAQDMLMWTTLYLVKASFLALIWTIFNVSANFRKAWYAVTVYTFLSFWPIFLSELWQCGDPADYDNPVVCQKSHERFASQFAIICFRFALHVTSDIFVLVLPLIYIRRLSMSKAKKVSVAAVFAIIIIDIVAGIMRSSASICTGLHQSSKTCFDMALITGVVEPCVAVLVCALPVYRALFPSSRKRRDMSDELRRNAAGIGLSSPRRLVRASDETLNSKAGPETTHMF